MPPEAELHYLCRPGRVRPVGRPVEFLSAAELLADEPACRALWELVSTQFRTRSKFLAVWSGVRFACVSRDDDGAADGFLLVNAPVNWQLDYVVVRPDRRGHGIAAALVTQALNQAFCQGVPYVMLTSRESLRSLYEGCGFEVVGRAGAPAPG